MRSISSCWDWLLTLGSELGETQPTVPVGCGLMKQPGTTLTGLQELRMIPVVMKTVFACSRIIIRANGMIKNAAIGEILFARKVWNLEFLQVVFWFYWNLFLGFCEKEVLYVKSASHFQDSANYIFTEGTQFSHWSSGSERKANSWVGQHDKTACHIERSIIYWDIFRL